MGIFDKVFASLRGGKNAGDSGHDKAAANENCISRQDNLKRMIELLLKKNYKGGNFSFDDKILRILITDSVQYYSLVESGFKTDLIIYLDGQMGVNFAEIDICTIQHGDIYSSFIGRVVMTYGIFCACNRLLRG